jgi:geranylgeranyl transferase type-1 subunit beta
MLDSFSMTNIESTREFLDECECFYGGGFSKVPDCHPDILHSFYSLCWLSLSRQEDLRLFNCALGICEDRL